MFLSKIWFILVAMLAGVAFSVALTAPRPMAQKLEELEGQRLDRAQYAAEQMLKVDAHKWIDRVANLGRDAVISEGLDSASKGSGELSVQHKTLQARLRALLPDLGGAGISTIAAIDGNGRAVARVGDDEKDYGDSIGGAEVISDALRGYLSDDVWGTGGHLSRVAAAPVLSKSRDRVVGALYVAAETGAQFADRLKKNLDVDVALLLMGKVVASTVDSNILSNLPELVSQHRAEIDEMKRTPALSIDVGDETYLAVAAPFPGQAGEQQGYYVLVGKKPAKADLGSVLANTTARDLKWGSFPWLPLVGSLLALMAIGLLLQRFEVESPMARLRTELRRLSRGEIGKLDDHRFGGHFGGIARDVNSALEHVGLQGSAPIGLATGMPGAAGALGIAGDAPMPGSAFADTGFGAGSAGGMVPPPPPGFAPPPAAGFVPPPPPGFPTTGGARPGSRAPAFPQAPGMSPSVPTFPSTPPLPGAAFGAPGSAAAADGDDEEQHVQTVYDEFIALKQQCGESVAGLTMDKFRLRLQENRNSLMARHACRTVRFSVYVKDGKASLRATPVK